jgi:hypothetical protein
MRVTRFHAFAIHLGISLVIFLVLLALLVLVWYRFPLFGVDGGWNGIKIIAGVDLILGPLLTLIVFKPGKPRLKLDLSIIACIQLAALAAGTWIVYAQRPVIMVFAEERFYSLSADTFASSGLQLADVDRFDDAPYPLAVVSLPDDEDERRKIRLQSFSRGGLYLRGDLYVPRNAQYLSDMQRSTVDMTKLVADDPAARAQLDRFSARRDGLDRFFFLPLHSRYGRVMLALDRDSGRIVDTLAIGPPEP